MMRIETEKDFIEPGNGAGVEGYGCGWPMRGTQSIIETENGFIDPGGGAGIAILEKHG